MSSSIDGLPAATHPHPAKPPAPESAVGAAADGDDEDGGVNFFGDDGFDFWDVLDMLNPLQHIPVVAALYREATGDEIGHLPRVAGSTLFLGPIGGLLALGNSIIKESTGKDAGEYALAAIGLDFGGGDTQPLTRTAGNEPDGPAAPSGLENDSVSAWARARQAYAASPGSPGEPYSEPGAVPAAPHDIDVLPDGRPVSLAAETPAGYADSAKPARSAAAVSSAADESGPIPDVTAWARAELAYAKGVRTTARGQPIWPVTAAAPNPGGVELTSLFMEQKAAADQTSTPANGGGGSRGRESSGFKGDILERWIRGQAALRHRDPSHRPNLAISAYTERR